MSSRSSSATSSFFGDNLTIRHILTSRRVVIGGVVVGLLVALLLWGPWRPQGTQTAAAQQSRDPIPVSAVTATRVEEFKRLREFSGVIKAARKSHLGFPRGGTVEQILVDVGATVAQGQLLATLNVDELSARKSAVTAQLAAAEAQLLELVNGARKETILAAEAEVAALDADLKLAQLNLKRREQLSGTSAISSEEYDRAIALELAMRSKLESARQALLELQNGIRPEKIAAQRATVAQFKALLKETEAQLADSQLTAPFDGQITERTVDDGSVTNPASPIMTLVEVGKVEAWIGLPSFAIENLQSQHEVAILVGQRTYTAELSAIVGELDVQSRTRTAVFRILESTNLPAHGENCRLQLPMVVPVEGIWVPTTALVRSTREL